MTAVLVTAGVPRQGAAVPTFRQLVAEMRLCQECGEPAGARSILARHPELARDVELLADLACEEFSQRAAFGENVNPVEFATAFPECGPGLVDMLTLRQFFDENPGLLDPRPDALGWPVEGEMLHGFALHREIGRGSFARVFLASEPDVGDRRVVVKVSFLDGAGEAEALGTLRHPNIVPIHSIRFEGDPGWSAVCMPYHGTATLAAVRARLFAGGRRPQRAAELLDAARAATADDPPDRDDVPSAFPAAAGYVAGALHLGERLADALVAVHARGLCHRDLKPANVIVTPAGRPMLIDFNLSCGAGAAGVGGTLPYMAPEQLRALLPEADEQETAVDARTDLFALGVLLHELLTGEHPFGTVPEGLSRCAQARWLLARQHAGAAPLRQAGVAVAPEVEDLVARCLAFDPADRPASAAAVARTLRVAIDRAPWRGAVRKFAGVAAGFLMAALTWAAVAPSPGPDELLYRAQEAYAAARHEEALEYAERLIQAEGETARAVFARGRARLQRGDVPGALADHELAARLLPCGKAWAALAECHHQPRFHSPGGAASLYREAVAAGYGPPAVWHNLGWNLHQNGERAEALDALARALAGDPELGAAYFARMRVGISLGRGQGDRALREMLQDMRRALELLPATGELHYEAARACCLVGDADAALHHAAHAVQLGCDPERIASDTHLRRALGDREAFAMVLRQRPGPGEIGPPQFLDPLGGSLVLD